MTSVVGLMMVAHAAWYWPFGSDDGDSGGRTRLSTLMEPATELIDEASDLAADGKIQDSVEKYRKALQELDRIEAENPERAKTQEFATVRNKRAYVNAAIDAMLLSQVRDNARVVAVSDTTELEKKLRAEREGKKVKQQPAAKPAETNATPKEVVVLQAELPKAEAKPVVEPARASAAPRANRPASGKARVAYDIAHGDFQDALSVVEDMLRRKPNDPAALNLKAAVQMAQGNLKAAEETLDQAIVSNPRNHYAYYNMALLVLRNDPTRQAVARRYYETGRAVGGPEDKELEELTK